MSMKMLAMAMLLAMLVFLGSAEATQTLGVPVRVLSPINGPHSFIVSGQGVLYVYFWLPCPAGDVAVSGEYIVLDTSVKVIGSGVAPTAASPTIPNAFYLYLEVQVPAVPGLSPIPYSLINLVTQPAMGVWCSTPQ
jgi:hypothetical protein